MSLRNIPLTSSTGIQPCAIAPHWELQKAINSMHLGGNWSNFLGALTWYLRVNYSFSWVSLKTPLIVTEILQLYFSLFLLDHTCFPETQAFPQVLLRIHLFPQFCSLFFVNTDQRHSGTSLIKYEWLFCF